MDINKLKELKNIEYKVIECCGTCIYNDIAYNSEFGVCLKFTYPHKKHQETRQLSIHRYGKCKDSYIRKPLENEMKIFFDYLGE